MVMQLIVKILLFSEIYTGFCHLIYYYNYYFLFSFFFVVIIVCTHNCNFGTSLLFILKYFYDEYPK